VQRFTVIVLGKVGHMIRAENCRFKNSDELDKMFIFEAYQNIVFRHYFPTKVNTLLA